MTKEEAIKCLKENLCSLCAYGSQNMDSCDIRECDNRDYIKALEQQPSDDCISRTQAIEYIEKQGLIAFLDSIQQPKMPITQGFKYITIDEAIRVVSERPNSDVIERSKIDKAIEEIEHYKSMLANPYNRKGMERALEILKRNIGE